MANKTIKFYGIGYAPTGQTASVTATIDGATIFTGAIPTIATSDPTPDPTQYDVVFTYDVDSTVVGTVPMSITLTAGGGFTVGRVEVNSDNSSNVFALMGNPEQLDCRTNVKINGVTQEKGPLADVLVGAWSWNVVDSGTLTYDLNIINPFPAATPT